MSVIFNCGFVRVAVKESFRKVGSASVETNPSEEEEISCSVRG